MFVTFCQLHNFLMVYCGTDLLLLTENLRTWFIKANVRLLSWAVQNINALTFLINFWWTRLAVTFTQMGLNCTFLLRSKGNLCVRARACVCVCVPQGGKKEQRYWRVTRVDAFIRMCNFEGFCLWEDLSDSINNFHKYADKQTHTADDFYFLSIITKHAHTSQPVVLFYYDQITLENPPLYFCLSLTLLSYIGAVRGARLSLLTQNTMCPNSFLIHFYSGGSCPIIFTPSFSRLTSVKRLKPPWYIWVIEQRRFDLW